ncbi:MAG: hypothetical protein KAH16_04965 [Candidatus Izimaplasma sp.]|nr:hypothetical protein [Candidatus Izimaplasma bacterium]
MKNIYAMIVVTILLFVASMDFLFTTNIFIDLAIVIIYLLLVGRSSLKLETSVKEVKNDFILKEKKSAFFAPLIFIFFLSITISFGIVMIIINALVIVLLYGYVFVSIKRNKIIVNNTLIKAEYLNGESMTLKWTDIVKVDFDWIYNLLILSDAEGIQIKLDITLSDFLLIIVMIKERLLKDDYENAFRKLHNYYLWFFMRANNIHLS